MGAFAVVGVVRLVRGEAPTGTVATVLGAVGLVLFVGLFGLAAWASFARRRDPGQVVVTPTRLVATWGQVPWQEIDAVFAHQVRRQGNPRAIDRACVSIEGRTITVYEAGHLDVDPRSALETLRRLHRDPLLRERLATDDGPGIFTEATSTRSET